ncbi:Uncharacterised protein [Stutzerimonas stutzeri]|uniref:hypothetical protein n=1 Tax=Stutzerimonas stutzeri subgroup TaxID=578833 RepID=UPI000C6DC16B|nr:MULTISPECIES: hypothetical protein [Stutzerimonas stutzeri subgroup]MCQ2048825.1 hypothetical protein [Stutzerimonas kunmingensis]PKR26547.1 hypothetical protein CXK90_12965 [Stutzerimonas stutzeri]QQC09351.1 hypothetical protein I6I22_10680 [Stutzerimonas stutzeri]VEI35334.1 Uncharacterised protein [Stutzerimonas stutzeri]
MASLQEQRRAIAEGMARSRAATGEAQRNAAGNSMVEQRTGRSVVQDINRLTRPRPQRKPLPSIEPVGAVPASRGRGDYKAPPPSAAGGIASPLTETASSRDYYAAVNRPSTDGLVFFSVRAVQRVHMTDANDAEVVLEFQNVTS